MCKNRYKQTKFDCMVTNETMQLMKAVIPYIDGPISNLLGIMIKFKELETMDMFKDMDTADIFQTMDDFSSSN